MIAPVSHNPERIVVKRLPVDTRDETKSASSVCLVVNRKSFRASLGKLASRACAIASRRRVDIIDDHRPTQVIDALRIRVDRGLTHLIVLAGDGTVQAVVDFLAHLSEERDRPALLILAGGRTNLIAGDLRGRRDVLGKLEKFIDGLASAKSVNTEERHTLVIQQESAPDRHGFFVAGAFIDSVIRECHRHRDTGHGYLRKGHLSDAWCLFKLACGALLGRKTFPPLPVLHVETNCLGSSEGPTRVLIASTLRHASGLFCPYASRGAGPLRITTVASRASGFWIRFPQILIGRFSDSMNVARGYLSGRCDRIEVMGLPRYVLDGEEFETDPGRPVVIRPGPALRFVIPK